MINVDVVEFVTLTLRGFCNSFYGYSYIPKLTAALVRSYLGKEEKKEDGSYDAEIIEALKSACIYNFIFTVIMLPVVFVFFPLCSIIVSSIISENLVLQINTIFYYSVLVFRVFPVTLYKIGHVYLFQDLAKIVHNKKKGKPKELGSIYMRMSDQVFNLIVQMVYGGQLLIVFYLLSLISDNLPSLKIKFLIIDDVIQFIIINGLTSIWYSLCLFEYKWYFMAWNLHRRLGYIEKNWPYFISFSFLYAVVTTQFDSYCLNALIAGILFPFYLISAYERESEENNGISSIPFFQSSVVVTNYFIRKINRKS